MHIAFGINSAHDILKYTFINDESFGAFYSYQKVVFLVDILNVKTLVYGQHTRAFNVAIKRITLLFIIH